MREGPAHYFVEFWRQSGPFLFKRRTFVIEDGIDDNGFVIGHKWRLTSQHLVEDDAHRPDISALVDNF